MMHGFSNARVWTLALLASTVTVSASAQQPAAPQQRAVVDQYVVGQAVPEPHRPSMGCSIKWRED